MRKVPRGIVALATVVVLFGLAAVSVAGVATDTQSQSTIETDENSTNYLSPTAPTGEEYERVTMDASTAVAADVQEVHAAHDTETFERRLQSADAEKRSAVAQAQLESSRDRLQRLDRRQATLFEAYSAGETSTPALLRELIALAAAIDAQSELIARAESDADPPTPLRVEVETLEDAVSVDQPVTERVQESLVGGEPTTVYLQRSDDGLVLGLIDDTDYYRQATLLSERDLDGTDQFGDDLSPGGYSEAQQRMEELYPWAYNLPNLQIGGDDDLSVYSGIYQLGLHHPHGELTAYFDGATTNVFHENQRLRLDVLPIDRTVSNTTESGTLTVETTRSTGAMRVTAESADGTAAEVPVRIGDQPVGTTDEEGTLWTVQPDDEFELEATMPDGTNVSVDWPPES